MAAEPIRTDLEGLDPVDRIIVDYLESADRGERPERANWLARHPEHRAELAQFLDDLERFSPAASLGSAVVDGSAADPDPSHDRGSDRTVELSSSRRGNDTVKSGAIDPRKEGGDANDFRFRGQQCGDYELLEVIGRGGMGVVFKARHRKLGRIVALKMISAGALASDSLIRRFEAEAKAAAQLDHPGLVPLFEVGQHEGLHYFTMAYIDGSSLASVLADGPLPARESARMMRDMAQAMDYAHRRGVIHRDLKPGNILLDGERHPKISDFGLAKRVEDSSSAATVDADAVRNAGIEQLTGTGQILGTPSFMAPEQALGQADRVGAPADIYGLGAVLFAMLTGRPPFSASTSWETLRHLLEEEAPPPRQLNPSVPRDLETICTKCLRKQPEQRYASAAALAEDLDRFLAGQPILARPIGVTERVIRWYRRHPAVGSMACALAILLVAVPVLLAGLWQEADARAGVEANGRQQETEARKKIEILERERTGRLFHAYVNEAEARRMSPRVGRRFTALKALGAARDLNLPDEDTTRLRSEAIGTISLTDMRDADAGPGWAHFEYPNPCLFRYATGDDIFLDWDAPTGLLARRIRDNRIVQRIPGVSHQQGDWPEISNDGRYVSTLRAGKLSVWRIDGDQPKALPGHERVAMSVFTDDRPELVLVTSDIELVAIPLEGNDPPRSKKLAGADVPVATNWWAAVRATSKRIAVACAGRVAIFDAESLKAIGECEVPSVVDSMNWSPDSNKLAIACKNATIVFYRLDTGSRTEVKGPRGGAHRVSFDPSSRYVLSRSSWTARNILWDFDSAKAELRFDDRELRSKSPRPAGPTLNGWWQAALDPPHRTIGSQLDGDPTPHKLGNSAIHPAGRLTATQTPEGVLLGDIATGRRLGLVPTGAGTSLSFDEQGNLFGYVNMTPHRWSVTKDGSRYKIGPAERLALPRMYMCLAISPDGRYVAEPVANGSMVLDRTTGKTTSFLPQGDVRAVAIDPANRYLASFGFGALGFRIWEIGTGKLVQTYDKGHLNNGRFTPDGKHLVTTSVTLPEFQLWSVPDFKMIRTLGAYGQIAVSPDSRLLAVAEPIGKIRLVRIDTGAMIARFDAPGEDYLIDIAFSPDGRYLMGVNLDETAHHVWDLWRLRRSLAQMKLDWDTTPAPEPAAASESITVEIEMPAAKMP